MIITNNTRRFWRRFSLRSIPAATIGLVVMLAASTSALAQRPTILEHTGELARYLDVVKIAEPVVVDDLAIYPVLVSGPPLLRGRWLTLDAALANGALAIVEKGTHSKPVLWAENTRSDGYLFLMKNEILDSGGQTRVVRQDTVLAPGERVELNVLSSPLPPSTGGKPLLTGKASVPPRVPEATQSPYQTDRRLDIRGKMGGDFHFGSVKALPKPEPNDAKLEQLCKEIMPRIPRGTTGFIFLYDGQPLGADFFGSEDLALKLLPKLLNSLALDQPGVSNMANDQGKGRNDAEATGFFERICGARSEATSTSGSGVGLRTSTGGLLGGGVVLDGLVVHYGIRVEELGTPYSRPKPSIIWPRSETHQQRQ